MELELYLLGPVRAIVAGRPLDSFQSAKTKALLLYLVTETALAEEPYPYPRERLMAMLWPQSLQRSAQVNLRQSLYQLRRTIPVVMGREGGEDVPFLLSDRQTVQINPQADYKLDVADFLHLVNMRQASPGQLAQAVGLYRGALLADFYLPDSEPFEVWAAARRASLQRTALSALEKLTDDFLEASDFEAAERYARRQLELDEYRESGHRQLMLALAHSGQRTQALEQFETYRRALAEELKAEPEPATMELADEIRSGEPLAEMGLVGRLSGETGNAQIPLLLKAAPNVRQKETPASEGWSSPFVGRERELGVLEAHLKRALQGEGRIVFVSGEAGEGKTSLLRTFARRARSVRADMVIASGNCSAFFGEGDPYLPFRDVLSALTGAEAGQFVLEPETRETDLNIDRALPLVLNILINQSPEVLDVFIPSAKLKQIIAARVERPDFWIQKVDAAAERSTALNRDRTQRQHFQSFTQLFQDISEKHPLLVMLDDLQWADSASIHLLFHLARRLAGSRILLVGAYRSSEISATRRRTGIQTHGENPLAPVIQELIRQFGDIHIDLGRRERVESEAFVSALLDSEPNRLGPDFRDSLLQKTNGHPLFTVELLRDIQARGHLGLDSQGRWYEKQPVDWEAIPVRVEAVIRQRVDRLQPELRKIIDVGSVEGESFTAQVVMTVLETNEWQILNDLSRELQTRHKLVHERGELLVQGRPRALFQFSHPLFHEYIYRALSAAERRWLHGQVGHILEELYGEQGDEIITQLARHFELAADAKAIGYLLQAGEAALAKFANAEAENDFRRALDLNPPVAAQARLHGGLGEALYRQGYKDEAIQAWRRGIDDFKALGSLEELARLYASAMRYLSQYWPVEALRFCETSLTELEELDESIAFGHLLHQAARTYLFNGQMEKAKPLCRRAVEIAERFENPELQADALATYGILNAGSPESALEMLRLAAKLAEASGSLYVAQRAYNNIGMTYIEQGKYRDALRMFFRRIELVRKSGAVEEEAHALANVFSATSALGDLSAALKTIEDIERLQQEAPHPEPMRELIRYLRAELAMLYGRHDEALRLVKDCLADAGRMGRVRASLKAINYIYTIIVLDLHTFGKWSDWTEVESLLGEVVARSSIGNMMIYRIDASFLLSIVHARQSDLDGARYWLAEARKIEVDEPHSSTKILHLSALAELAAAEKRWDEAINSLESIIEITMKTEQRWERAHRLLELAEIHRRRSDADDGEMAQTLYRQALDLFTEMGATGFVEVIQERLN